MSNRALFSLIQFMNIAYVPGLNLYYLLRDYSQAMSRRESAPIRVMAKLLRRGQSFADIMAEVCNSKAGFLFRLAQTYGDQGRAIQKLYLDLCRAQDYEKQRTRQLFYPILLLGMIFILLLLLSIFFVPQLKNLYAGYQLPIPWLLRIFSLKGLLIATGVLMMAGLGIREGLRRFPAIMSFKSLFLREVEQRLYELIQTSILFNVPLTSILDEMMDQESNLRMVYAFSTLSATLKQGKSLEEALKLLSMNKQCLILHYLMCAPREKQLEAIARLIAVQQEELNRYRDNLLQLSSVVIIILAGFIVMGIGYVTILPVQTLIQVM